MRSEAELMAALVVPGADILPKTPDEELVAAMAKDFRLEDAAFAEILGRLLVVDAEHPELHIRLSLQTLYARAQGGADLTEDLRALIKQAQPFLER